MAAPGEMGVHLGSKSDSETIGGVTLGTWFDRAAAVAETAASLQLALEVGAVAPTPASGNTAALWELLATIAAAEVEVARVIEPHLDALAILAEARSADFGPDLSPIGVDDRSTWGVFAAEGRGMRLQASVDAGRWSLTGTKPWCSLASHLSHALVTAHTPAGRALFAVNLRGAGVRTHDELWVSRGMPGVPSAPVDFDRVAATAVGGDGWYLRRSGFSWGGLGVAAIWWGGAIGVARAMIDAARAHEPDEFTLAHLGAVDQAIDGTRAVLADASHRVDAKAYGRSIDGDHGDHEPVMTDADARLLAARGRAVAARCAETVLERSSHSLGPGAFALDASFVRRHADLAMYVRQHHAERDDAHLGRMILDGESPPW